MDFKKGANPFAKTSQEPLDILESITAVEIASCVPVIKIEKIDSFGKASTDVRPLMYDLIQAPRFGAGEDDFGIDSDTFIERALVSLNNVTVSFNQQYGQQLFREVTLDFTVHHPAVVFDRSSKIAWREILMEGTSFTLEYGWRGDPSIVRNPLFNGDGHVSESGQILKSTQLILLNISSYSLDVMQTGEVKVSIKASENGDLCLREMKFSDAFEADGSIGSSIGALRRGLRPFGAQVVPDDADNIKVLRSVIDRLLPKAGKGRGEYYMMGDILDKIIAPMVTAAGKAWDYDGVDLLLGKFNKDAPPQSENYFGQPMADHGIEDFRVPTHVFNDLISKYHTQGRALHLQQFISTMINIVNGDCWANPAGKSYQKPKVMLKSDTVRTNDGLRLILTIHDVTVGSHPFGMVDEGQNRIPLDGQSKEEIFKRLKSLNVPILEFAKAGSLITDANFQLQPDPKLQSIQVEASYHDRKDRGQQANMPDVESRKGQALSGELRIPVSILEGEIQMHGNFALEVFGAFWIEFFGSPEISGVYHVNGKTDALEAGMFKSTFRVISEGIDPLNTRHKRSEQELMDARERGKKITSKSNGATPGQHAKSSPTTPKTKIPGTVVRRGS